MNNTPELGSQPDPADAPTEFWQWKQGHFESDLMSGSQALSMARRQNPGALAAWTILHMCADWSPTNGTNRTSRTTPR